MCVIRANFNNTNDYTAASAGDNDVLMETMRLNPLQSVGRSDDDDNDDEIRNSALLLLLQKVHNK